MNIKSIALVVFGLFSLQVSAATVTFSYDQSFGAVPALGPAPYATASFMDTGVDTVTLEMQVASTVGAADVTGMYFNLDSALDPTSLTFTRIGGTGPTAGQTISRQPTRHKIESIQRSAGAP